MAKMILCTVLLNFSGNSAGVKVGMRAVSCEVGRALLENPLSSTPVKAWVSIGRTLVKSSAGEKNDCPIRVIKKKWR